MIDSNDNSARRHQSLREDGSSLSYPDEEELRQIIRATLQRLNRNKPIEIGITPKGLDTIVRNLRGLTRRQAATDHQRCRGPDQQFNDDDINVVIANKRRMIQQGGLLEYMQTPLDLERDRRHADPEEVAQRAARTSSAPRPRRSASRPPRAS